MSALEHSLTSIAQLAATLGLGTGFGYNCFVTKASVGRYAGIGNNVSIGLGEHKLDRIPNAATLYDEENIYEVLTEQACTIGADVWIGVDSIIRRGTEIGTGAVVGANSLCASIRNRCRNTVEDNPLPVQSCTDCNDPGIPVVGTRDNRCPFISSGAHD